MSSDQQTQKAESKPLQPDMSYDALRQQAAETNPKFMQSMQGAVKDVTDQNPDAFSGLEFRSSDIKSDESATGKMDRKYGTQESPQRYIQDWVRGTIVADTPEQIEAITKHIKENFDVVDEDNRFNKPSETGFRDNNLKIRMGNGHIVEVQIHHRDMLEANKKTHPLFEEKRELDRVAKNREFTPEEFARRVELTEQMRDIHGEAAAQAGLDNKLDPSVRSKFERPMALADALGKVGKASKNPIVDAATAATVTGLAVLGGDTPAQAMGKGADVLNPFPETTDALSNGGDVMKAAVKDAFDWSACARGAIALGALAGQTGHPAMIIAGGVAGCVAGSITGKSMREGIESFFDPDNHEQGLPQTNAERLTQIRATLPDTITDDMPPELQSLIVVKQSDELLAARLASLKENDSEGMQHVAEYLEDKMVQAADAGAKIQSEAKNESTFQNDKPTIETAGKPVLVGAGAPGRG